MVNLDSAMEKPLEQTMKSKVTSKSFAQILSGEDPDASLLAQPPLKVVMSNAVRVKISRASYEVGLAACKTHLHGRLFYTKGTRH